MTACPVIGHEKCRIALAAELPAQPVLLLGPESTGKWLLARWLADQHAAWHNQWSAEHPGVGDIRELRRFLQAPPHATAHLSSLGHLKVATVNLDGAKSLSVQHALLKELEEPPAYARFLLTASRSPLPTVSSRCVIWRLGLLDEEQVVQVLTGLGTSPAEARALAPAGRGQVGPALAAAPRYRPARQAALAVMRAVADRDRDALERAARDWGEPEDWMLRELLAAAASGAPSPVFSPAERIGTGRTTARRGIALLAAAGACRPQVAVRAMACALMEAR